MRVLSVSKWFGIVFLVIGILIYKSTFEATLLGSAIVGGISAGIGGALGELYETKFGKYDYNIMYFIDNIIWLVVFCVPGALLGSIVDSLISYFINGNWDNQINGTTILIVMTLTSLFLTYKKLRSKQRKRFQQSQEESQEL